MPGPSEDPARQGAELWLESGPLRGVSAEGRDGVSAFHVVSIVGEEAISELFSFEIVVLAEPHAVQSALDGAGAEAELLMQDVAFRVGPAGDVRRGMLAEVRVEGAFRLDERPFVRLRLRVVPRAWLLTQRKNSRIFQHAYVHEIVGAVLAESGVRYRWDLRRPTYPRRVYCTQYEETDWDFVRRLFAEEGILFFFEPTEKHAPRSPSGDDGGLDAAGHARRAAKIGKSVSKELGGIGDSTGDGALQGIAGVAGASAGLTADLLREQRDEEDTAPRRLGDGLGGPSGAGEVLVFIDVPAYQTAMTADGGPLVLHLRDDAGLVGDQHQLEALAPAWRTAPRSVEVRDYDFRRPLLHLAAREGEPLDGDHRPGKALEVYDHHGEYGTPHVDGEAARIQLEQHRRDAAVAHGRARSPRVAAGHTFQLEVLVGDRSAFPPEGRYAVVWVRHEYSNPHFGGTAAAGDLEGVVRGCARAIREAVLTGEELPEEELRKLIRGEMRGGTPAQRLYENRFRAVSADVAYRPPRPARVLRHVTESATVVGPPGQDIYVDRHGRVKVQFHWDREGRFNEHSSCWLRVAQSWAGAGYGLQFFPRSGMEVLVTFLGGDTDKPVIIGALYNATHATPEPLPERATRSGIRTQTSPDGGGFNELSFEDAKRAERVYLHAERDFQAEVNHDHDLAVGNRHRVSVGGAQETGVAADQITAVGGDRSVVVGGNASAFVDGRRSTRVMQDLLTSVRFNAIDTIGRSAVRSISANDLHVVGGGRVASIAGVDSIDADVVSTYARGFHFLSAKDAVEVRAAADGVIRLVCGDSAIEVHKDRIELRSKTIALLGDKTVEAAGGKAWLRLEDKGELVGEKVRVHDLDDNGIVVLKRIDGASIVTVSGDKLHLIGEEVDFTVNVNRNAPGSGSDSEEQQAPNLKLRLTHGVATAPEPIANTKYSLLNGPHTYQGETDGDGRLAVVAEPASAVLTVFANETYPDLYKKPLAWAISLTEEPLGDPDIFQNLGYALSGDALRQFQLDAEIPETGEADDRTRSKAREVYES